MRVKDILEAETGPKFTAQMETATKMFTKQATKHLALDLPGTCRASFEHPVLLPGQNRSN